MNIKMTSRLYCLTQKIKWADKKEVDVNYCWGIYTYIFILFYTNNNQFYIYNHYYLHILYNIIYDVVNHTVNDIVYVL